MPCPVALPALLPSALCPPIPADKIFYFNFLNGERSPTAPEAFITMDTTGTGDASQGGAEDQDLDVKFRLKRLQFQRLLKGDAESRRRRGSG